MARALSEPVSAAAATAEKLRADDRLITDTGQQLEEIESLLDTITVLQSVVTERLAEAGKVGATADTNGTTFRSGERKQHVTSNRSGAERPSNT